MRFDWLIGFSNTDESARGDTPAKPPSVSSVASESSFESSREKVRSKTPETRIAVNLNKDLSMPIGGVEHDRYGRLARVKPRSSKDKDRDSDTRSNISGITASSRRHRDSSSSSSRTTLPVDNSEPVSKSGTQAPNLDQLPKLPESESSSPSTASSPLSRSISTVSEPPPTALISPASLRTPASLQPYLENYSDSTDNPIDKLDSSQVTPRPEKSKETPFLEGETAKNPAPAQNADETTSNSSQTSSCDTVKATAAQSPTRTDSSSLAKRRHSLKESHRLGIRRTDDISIVSRSSTPGSIQSYNHTSGPSSQQTPHERYYSYYQHMPTGASPVSHPPGMPAQNMPYYAEYGIPPPAPVPPHHLQYPPQQIDRSRDEHAMALLQRVDCAIPDLHLLMHSYQENYAMLEASESQIRSMEIKRATEMQKADSRFTKMEKEIKSMLDRHATEKKALELEMSNMELKCKQLEQKLKAEGKHNEELNEVNQRLIEERRDAEKRHKDEMSAMVKGFSVEKEKVMADHRANQREMHDQLQATTRKLEANHAYQIAENSRAHEEEKQRIEVKWAKYRRESEERQNGTQRDLEMNFEAKQRLLDDERRSFLQTREVWDRDREDLVRKWEEERSLLQKTSEEQRRALNLKYQREKDDPVKQMSQTHGRADGQDTILSLQKEIDSLKLGWEADRLKFHKATLEFKMTVRTFNDQNSRLQKLAETFEDGGETRGKRDSPR